MSARPILAIGSTGKTGRRNATLARGLQDALGREPRDFAGFCRSTAAAGVWQR
jgi:hypothetical protein